MNVDIRPLRDDGIDGLLVRLRGEFDAASAPRLAHDINEAFTEDLRTLVFDCTELGFLNSTAVGHLIAYRKLTGSRGGQTFLVGLQPRTEEILDLLGALDLFPRYGTVDEALKSIAATPEEVTGDS